MSVSARPSEEAVAPRRRTRAWRVLGAVLGLALLLPVALAGALLLGANTEPARAALARLAASFVPGLAIEELRGPLPGRPGFARLTLADEAGVWLEVEEARLAWDPLALLRGELRIEALTAERLALHRLPAGAPEQSEAEPGPLIPDLPELPLALRLERLEVAEIELAEPVLGTPLTLRAVGSASLDETGLTAELRAATPGDGTSLSLDAALRPVTGRLSARLVLRGEAGGPLSRLAGLGDRPIGLDLALDGPAESAAVTFQAAAGPGLGAELAGRVSAPDTARLGAELSGTIDASGLVEGPAARLAGPVEVALDAQRLPEGLVELRRLTLAGTAGRLSAAGRLDPEGDRTALRLEAALPDSAVFGDLLPAGSAGWEALVAEGEVTGRLAAPRVALTLGAEGFRTGIAPLAALLGPAPRLSLRAEAPDRIELLTLAGQAIEAELRGRVGETLDLAFATSIAATEGAVPGLTGALRLEGTATGPADNPTLAVEARSDRLDAAGRVLEQLALSARLVTPATRPELDASATGRLQDLPLSLSLRGAPAGEGWLRLEAAEATLGPARLTASGRVNPGQGLADGEARLEVPELSPFAPLIGQPVAGAVRLEARGAPVEGRQTLSARLEVPRLNAAGAQVRELRATAEGSLAALDLAVAGRVNDVELETRGRLTEAGDARRLDLAALRSAAFGETLRLAEPARITLRPDGGVEIGSLALALPRSGTLRAEGAWGPERADLRANLAGLDLAAFAAFAPDLAPAGTVSGEARVTGPTAAPELVASLRGTGLRSGAARGLPPGELRLDLRRVASGLLTAEAEARLGPQQRLAATARFPRGPGAEAPFEATLDGTLDLGQLASPFLAAGADRVTGRLALALRATGTPAEPVMGGEARLSGGSYRNAPLGVAITDVGGLLRPDGPRLRLDITGRTPGEGRIALAGTIEPFTRYLPLDILLTANGAQPVNSDLLRATLDAELHLAGLFGLEARLSGPIRVERAEIRIPERLGGGVRTLGPVTERGRPPGVPPRAPARPPAREAAAQADTPPGPPIALAITVSAPRNVFVRGRGLDAELGGQLAIGGRLADPQITGVLELRRGDLSVAGRRLDFERGRLAWDGGLLPNLALRATSQAGQVTARVDVTGPPTAPEITFSSTPELPQDEVLARLLFDRPLRDLSPLEIAQIAAAAAGATGLPGGGAGGVLDRLRQGLGLDRLAVGSGGEGAGGRTSAEDRSNPTVEAGRYVADGVYVGVRQGTEAGSSRVGVRVDLTPRLRLEAETGDREAGNRVGLSYQWEWGR